MSEQALPAEVRALLRGPVATMAHVEALLLLRRLAPHARAVDAIAAEARIASPPAARRCLDELAAAGLLAVDDGHVYRYAPAGSEARAAVDVLARMYNEKPVTLVRALYSRLPGPGTPPAGTDVPRVRRAEG